MNENLMQGVSVMLIGMGTVVAFLCITIISMFVMSFVVGKLNKLFPEAVPAVAGRAGCHHGEKRRLFHRCRR